MEDKIISVLNKNRNSLSDRLETELKELTQPFDDLVNRMSEVEAAPLKISTLSIEEIDNSFPNISVKTIEELEMYKKVSKFSFFVLTEAQKLDISNIMKRLIEQIDKIKKSIIDSNVLLKELDDKIREVDDIIEKVTTLYSSNGYLKSSDIITIANILKESNLSVEEQIVIVQELSLLSLTRINSNEKEDEEEESYIVEETTLNRDELIEVFIKYGYKFDDFKDRDQAKLLKYGNLSTIAGIFEALKKEHVYIDIKEFSHKLTQIFINSNETIISTILENIKNDCENARLESKDTYHTIHELSVGKIFSECLNAPSIFIKGKREYKKRAKGPTGGPEGGGGNNSEIVYGSYDNYVKNRELLIKKGIDINEVIMKCISLLSMPYQRIKENFDSFEFYQIPEEVYSNTLSSLKAADSLSAIDQFIELGCYDYILSNFSYVNRRPDDLMFYRIVKATQLGESIYSDRNTRDTQFLGKISNDKKNGYGINNDNKEEVVEQYIPEFNPIYDEVVNKDRNAGPVILTYRNYFITMLEDKYKMDDLRYDFNGVIISRFKVLRIYETLMNNRTAGTYNAVLYAICKNSILTEEQYKNITDCLDRTFGNLKGVARR